MLVQLFASSRRLLLTPAAADSLLVPASSPPARSHWCQPSHPLQTLPRAHPLRNKLHELDFRIFCPVCFQRRLFSGQRWPLRRVRAFVFLHSAICLAPHRINPLQLATGSQVYHTEPRRVAGLASQSQSNPPYPQTLTCARRLQPPNPTLSSVGHPSPAVVCTHPVWHPAADFVAASIDWRGVSDLRRASGCSVAQASRMNITGHLRHVIYELIGMYQLQVLSRESRIFARNVMTRAVFMLINRSSELSHSPAELHQLRM